MSPTVVPNHGSQTQTILLLTDTHVPDHDEAMARAVRLWLQENAVDELGYMGDILELESASQHKGSRKIKLTDDWKAGRAYLRLNREAALEGIEREAKQRRNDKKFQRRKLKSWYLEGNHETRLTRLLSEKEPNLEDALSVPEGLRLDDLDIEWIPEDQQPISRGTLDILHGHQVGGGEKKSLPKHHSAKVIEIYGMPGRVSVYGHTHKPQIHTAPGFGGKIKTAVGLGCGRTLNPKWLHGQQAGWAHQFGVAYVRPDGQSELYVVNVLGGTFTWNGRLYDGR